VNGNGTVQNEGLKPPPRSWRHSEVALPQLQHPTSIPSLLSFPPHPFNGIDLEKRTAKLLRAIHDDDDMSSCPQVLIVIK